MVSTLPSATRRRNGGSVAGGKKLETKRSIVSPPRRVNRPDHSPESVANRGADQRDEHGEGGERPPRPRCSRCCRCHASHLRSSALERSAIRTRATNTISMVSTSSPASILSDSSICMPRPPAPTKPITTEARMAHSQR